jgi:hypothetical protein
MRREAGRGEWFARVSVGPLALAGFFLPWAQGPGPLAATEFTGYKLVGYAGRLQALDLSVSASGALWVIRLMILGVAVAAVWQIALAPWARHHPAYRLSGWYLVLLAALCAVLGIARHGIVIPSAGVGVMMAAAVVFVLAEVVALRRRPVPAEGVVVDAAPLAEYAAPDEGAPARH